MRAPKRSSRRTASDSPQPALGRPGVSTGPAQAYASSGWVPAEEPAAEAVAPRAAATAGYYDWGYAHAAHGLRGEYLLHLDTDHPERYLTLQRVWVVAGQAAPRQYTVRSLRPQGAQQALLALEGIEDRTQAEALLPLRLVAPLAELPPLTGTGFYYHEVIGWRLLDGSHPVGIIRQVLEAPAQDLLEVQMGALRALVPIVRDWVVQVDREGQALVMTLPVGLIELYRAPDAASEPAAEAEG